MSLLTVPSLSLSLAFSLPLQWKELEPDQLMDAKLKCVFDMPVAEASAENTSGGVSVSAAVSVSTNAPVNMNIADSLKSDAPKLSVDEQVRCCWQ